MFTPKLNARFLLSITSIKFHVAVQEGSDCGWLVCEHFLKGLGLDGIEGSEKGWNLGEWFMMSFN